LTVAAASLTLAFVSTPETPFPESRVEDLTAAPSRRRETGHDPDNPPWGVLSALGVWLMSFVFMLVTQMAFIVGYLLYRRVDLASVAEVATKDPGAIFVAILSLVPAHAFTLGLAWLLVTGVGKRPFLPALGWDWGRGGFNLWRSGGLAVALLLLGAGIIKLTGNPPTELDRLIDSSRATALATAFLATFTAPFVEEVVYRGVLYSALRRAAGTAWAVAIVGLVFTGIHVLQYWGSVGVITTIFLLSFVLTLIRAYTGRLLPCFVVHLVFNAIQSVFIVISPYVEQLSPEKTPTPGPAPSALLHTLLQLLTSHV
jgi:membrane protease YdiL (CAAX protease family)